ncbi:MAG: nuclear transport factor 2 family protein [Flavobacteriaceae bacterium]|nr:nuclear transport factor 2 family protein [Flavobacteriaceae bacterium]MDH3795366.1 nuclear transport factor 2 family protein [Flavobacteriaceae bacterium]
MNKITLIVLFISLAFSVKAQDVKQAEVGKVLDEWHRAAANADYEAYFARMTDRSIFIGTDATENWSVEAFKAFSKPYFDKGKAWNFEAVERNVFFNNENNLAWFDELLDTWMGICRGSGVLQKDMSGNWKIAHYVLSIAVPNEHVDALLAIKKEADSVLTKKLRSKPKM